jgi:hypothetical protein
MTRGRTAAGWNPKDLERNMQMLSSAKKKPSRPARPPRPKRPAR